MGKRNFNFLFMVLTYFFLIPALLLSQVDTAWIRRYNGPANDYDYTEAIAIDNEGNVYVTGRSKGMGTDFDYATVKYNSNGIEEWVLRYNGPSNGVDGANALTVDNFGNVYVTGRSFDSENRDDYVTIKYIPQGPKIGEEKENKITKKIITKRNKIYNISGKLVKDKKLKKGVYFLKTEKENKKIVILK